MNVHDTVGLTLDGADVRATPETTLLDLARSVDVRIPTLCHDPRLEPEASCWLCVVEVRQPDGTWRNEPACDTRVSEGLQVRTSSPAVVETRRWAIELLLSDHFADCVAPCASRCPADVDIPRYVRAVAEGRYGEAVEVIRETNPLPSVCGRVCPHPCESSCDRGVVDEPIAINQLKRLATELADPAPVPETSATGHAVAIVGAGPAGLSAAWFLKRAGHDVTVYDARSEPGGMLRYGIPDFRLPRAVLEKDLDALRAAGVKFVGDRRLGRNLSVGELLESGHAAVFLALGTWRGRALRVPGEEADGVFGGVPFLVMVAEEELTSLDCSVVVVGGGNTAVDAARTAIRLGASSVTLVYRRDRAQMPAFAHEVDEALQEGVKLRCLAAPTRVMATDGRVGGLAVQQMKLGDPGRDGRPKPMSDGSRPTVIQTDLVITAIGELADRDPLVAEGLVVDEGTLHLDERTHQLGAPGVFAGGDFVTGPSTAVEAIGAGRRAATSIDAWLRTGKAGGPPPLVVSRRSALGDIDPGLFPGVVPAARSEAPLRSADQRRADFGEVEAAVPEPIAQGEALRCLQCGCDSFDACTLRELMDEYQIDPARLAGHAHHYELRDLRPGIRLDMNKCIRCNRCVRVCDKLADVHAIDFVQRGFDVELLFAVADDATMSRCDACLGAGAFCIDTCPTGAVMRDEPEIIPLGRQP